MESHRGSHVEGELGISQGICCLKAVEVFYLGLVGFEVVHACITRTMAVQRVLCSEIASLPVCLGSSPQEPTPSSQGSWKISTATRSSAGCQEATRSRSTQPSGALLPFSSSGSHAKIARYGSWLPNHTSPVCMGM